MVWGLGFRVSSFGFRVEELRVIFNITFFFSLFRIPALCYRMTIDEQVTKCKEFKLVDLQLETRNPKPETDCHIRIGSGLECAEDH